MLMIPLSFLISLLINSVKINFQSFNHYLTSKKCFLMTDFELTLLDMDFNFLHFNFP